MTLTDQVNKLSNSYAEIAVRQPEALVLLQSVYKTLFGEPIKKDCGDCNYKAFIKIQKEIALQSSKSDNFTIENMKQFKDRAFVLHTGRTLQTEFGGDILTNDSLTDEAAIKLLSKHPNLLKHFAKYPTNEAGGLDIKGAIIKQIIPGGDASGNSEILGANAVSAAANNITPADAVNAKKAATPPHKRGKKGVELKLPLDGETVKDAAVRLGVNERTIQRDVKKAKQIAEAGETQNENTEPEAKQMVSIRGLLTEQGLFLAELYDLEAMEAALLSMPEEDREEAAEDAAAYLNGSLTEADEIADIEEGLKNYLKNTANGDQQPTEEPEAVGPVTNTTDAAISEAAANEGPEGSENSVQV